MTALAFLEGALPGEKDWLQKAPEIRRKALHRECIEANLDAGSSASLLAPSCCARIAIETWHPLDSRR